MKHRFQHYLDSFHLDSIPQGREFLALTEKLRNDPSFACLAEYRHHLSVNRLQHVTSVAYLSFLACRERGLCAEDACRGALLHDLFYYDRNHKGAPAFLYFRHPAIALENASRLYALSEIDEDVILHHMWPLTLHRPKTKEGRIVSLMDKYCAIHEFFNSLFPFFYRMTSKTKGNLKL